MVSIDEFLLRMIEAGHTAIFQWIAVYVASGIGVIQIIIEVLKKSFYRVKIIYGVIYLVLIITMTYSTYSILNVMHLQNYWANQLSNNYERNLFYGSRSSLSTLIVGCRVNFSMCEYGLILGHLLLLFAFGTYVWLYGFLHENLDKQQ